MIKTDARAQLELVVVLNIIGNVLCTVGVVLANKYLWVEYQFKYMITLSCFHFIFTALGCRVLLYFGFFQYKDVPMMGVMPVALGSLSSVAFMNLNLAYNSVGFYQISKLVCIPVTLVLQFYMFGDMASLMIRLSLVVILAGVGVATVSDISLNLLGCIFAGLAIICTALAQIFTHSKPKELGLDSMQLLHHASPIIAVGMGLLIPFGYGVPGFDKLFNDDTSVGLLEYKWSFPCLCWIFLTCVLAFGVNVTNYLVISKTSPVTYQVVGHLKTCLILVFGFVVFHYPVKMDNVFGICLAVAGMIWYTEQKRKESAAAVVAYSKVSTKEEELSQKVVKQ